MKVHLSSFKIELLVGAVCSLSIVSVASRLDVLEDLYLFSREYEYLELDELLPLSLFTTIFFLFCTLRRWRETERIRRKLEIANALLKKQNQGLEIEAGLLNLCASCKSVQPPGEGWTQLGPYLKEHANLHIFNGLCPECKDRNCLPDVVNF